MEPTGELVAAGLGDERSRAGVEQRTVRLAGHIEDNPVGDDQSAGGMPGRDIDLHPERVRLPEVVGVEEGEMITGRHRDTGVARGSESLVRSGNGPDPVTEGAGAFDAVVAGTVVDHDHLCGRVRLREYALEGLGKVTAGVVRRDHHAHPRSRHVTPRSPWSAR